MTVTIEEGKGKRADKIAEATIHNTNRDLTKLFEAFCDGHRELTEEDSFHWGLGYFRSNDNKLNPILYYLIITLQEQIYHFWHWLSHAHESELDEHGVHRKALVLWRDLKNQNQNISMEGALVGAFAVIVQTLPSKPENCLVNKAFQTARQQAKMSEEAKAHASSSASSSGDHPGVEDPEVKAKEAAWRKFDEIVYTAIVLPLVHAGVATPLPKNVHDENCGWWDENVKPILVHDDVYQYFGTKRRATQAWFYCAERLSADQPGAVQGTMGADYNRKVGEFSPQWFVRVLRTAGLIPELQPKVKTGSDGMPKFDFDNF